MRSHGDSKRNEIFFDDITLCNYPLWAQLKLQTCSRQCFCLLVLSARGYLCMCALFYEVLNFSMKEKKNRLLRLFFLPVVERIFKTRLRYKFFSGKTETRWREKNENKKFTARLSRRFRVIFPLNEMRRKKSINWEAFILTSLRSFKTKVGAKWEVTIESNKWYRHLRFKQLSV